MRLFLGAFAFHLCQFLRRLQLALAAGFFFDGFPFYKGTRLFEKPAFQVVHFILMT